MGVDRGNFISNPYLSVRECLDLSRWHTISNDFGTTTYTSLKPGLNVTCSAKTRDNGICHNAAAAVKHTYDRYDPKQWLEMLCEHDIPPNILPFLGLVT